MRREIWLVAGLFAAGCGTLGPPVPPEYVGVGPLLEKERIKEKQAKEAQERKDAERKFSAEESRQDPSVTGEGLIPPPLQPVGTR